MSAAFGHRVEWRDEVAGDDWPCCFAVLDHGFYRGFALAPVPIAEVLSRWPVVVAGRVADTAVVERAGCRSLVARLEDATGALDLVFLGRAGLWGVDVGRLLSADGVIGRDRGRRRMLNPLITLYAGRGEL